jgi:hypothetical protein
MFLKINPNIFSYALTTFRQCFTKPQWRHFLTYILGLLLSEKGEKNIQDISNNLLDAGDQSSLNRFITKHRWNPHKLNALRLKENLKERKGGVLILDDSLIEKRGCGE